MAEYTMELREIVSKINIFDFDYPIWKEEYREIFESKFINHFYFREIGVETVARFKHNLKEQLNLIMPYYNKMYYSQSLEQRILDNYDITETFEKVGSTDKQGAMNSTNKELYSDTGRKRVDINDVDFVSNINKMVGDSSSTSKEDNTEKWTRKMQGNIGVATDADAVTSYEKALKNIDLLVFNELDILFMGVY